MDIQHIFFGINVVATNIHLDTLICHIFRLFYTIKVWSGCLLPHLMVTNGNLLHCNFTFLHESTSACACIELLFPIHLNQYTISMDQSIMFNFWQYIPFEYGTLEQFWFNNLIKVQNNNIQLNENIYLNSFFLPRNNCLISGMSQCIRSYDDDRTKFCFMLSVFAVVFTVNRFPFIEFTFYCKKKTSTR